MGIRSAASVPLKTGGEIIGAMTFGSTTRMLSWTADLVRQLKILAEVFSNAIARKRSTQALLASIADLKSAEAALRTLSGRLMEAQEQERTRIARELHDDINQRLAVLAIELQQLNLDSPIDLPARSEELFKRTVGISGDVQALSHQLHSSKLEFLGIVAAIKGFCAESAAPLQNVTIAFESSGVPSKLPHDLSICLFRVLQEALRNAVKYSGVRHVEVCLEGTAAAILLKIRDRGRGFGPEAAMHGPGLGLLSMRERVSLVKGTIHVTSKPGLGTEISVRVPFDPTNASLAAPTKHVYGVAANRVS
jgi:signal transduction histidine kinase